MQPYTQRTQMRCGGGDHRADHAIRCDDHHWRQRQSARRLPAGRPGPALPRTAPPDPPALVQTPTSLTRLLGAIFPRGDQHAWVFKLTGPDALVQEHADAFERFIRTVRIVDKPEEPITWTLPDGWRRMPGDKFRYATLPAGTARRCAGRVGQRTERRRGRLGARERAAPGPRS